MTIHSFGSLCAGIGGIDLGLERAGWRCRWQVEIDDYARTVLSRRFPTAEQHRDVRSFPPDAKHNGRNVSEDGTSIDQRQEPRRIMLELKRRPKISTRLRVELIAAGFPCQDISDAGKRRGIFGSRSGLFFECCRVIQQIKPRFVFFENVAALLTGGRGMDVVLGQLFALGYDAEWHCLQAANFGAPHIRDRVFIIAHSNNEDGRSDELPENGPPSPIFAPKLSSELYSREWWTVEPVMDRMVYGFPGRVDRIKGLGNAVVPQIAEAIGKAIIEYSQKNT